MTYDINTIYTKYKQLTKKQRLQLLAALQSQGINIVKIEAYEYADVLLPYFLCESVVHTCQENQIETEFYHLNEKLEVLYPKEQLPEGEYLYLVNYYGQLSDSQISEYKKIYGNIIVDHTHAFFQKPLKGIDTLYSCRKFWGVSDGDISVNRCQPDRK